MTVSAPVAADQRFDVGDGAGDWQTTPRFQAVVTCAEIDCPAMRKAQVLQLTVSAVAAAEQRLDVRKRLPRLQRFRASGAVGAGARGRDEKSSEAWVASMISVGARAADDGFDVGDRRRYW